MGISFSGTPPHRLLVGLAGFLIFLFPALSLVVDSGGSGAFTALALLALLLLPFLRGRQTLTGEEKIMLLAFAGFFVWAIASMYIVEINHEAMKRIVRYSRLFTFIPVYFLIRRLQPSVHWLLAGVVAGSIAAGFYAIMQTMFGWEMSHPGRASGVLHPVYFGDFALLMAFMSVAMIRLAPSNLYKAVVLFAFMSGVTASALSGTRGAWLAVPLLVLVVVREYWKDYAKQTRLGIVLLLVLVPVVLYFSPQFKVSDRIHAALSDIEKYEQQVSVETSLGQRFELWRAAWKMIEQHPLLGVGTGNYGRELGGMIENGEFVAALAPFGNPHNEYLNVMATRGVPGLLSLLLIFAVPLYMFYRIQKNGSRRASVVASAGMVVVVGFAVFSLSAAPFERALPASTYVFYVYTLLAMLYGAEQSAGVG